MKDNVGFKLGAILCGLTALYSFLIYEVGKADGESKAVHWIADQLEDMTSKL